MPNTSQGRLPQELRVAGITSLEAANRFLRERYIKEFNAKLTVKAAERGTAFRRSRADLDWIFTVQTERVVAKDNTVAIAARSWQLDKSRFRPSSTLSIRKFHTKLYTADELVRTGSVPASVMDELRQAV
jgi:hypothetical protein